jgi:superfamily II DNA or RNA helicase
MTSLRPYQQQLLSILQDPDTPRSGVITSAPGSGIRRAVEIHLRDVGSDSLALVLCPTRVAVDQWIERLRGSEDPPVAIPISASSALDLLERRSRLQTGVLVATYASTTHGPGSRMLSDLDFGLIVLDPPPLSLTSQIEGLTSSARRVIAITDGRQRSWWAQWPLIWHMTYEDLVRSGYVTAPVSVLYEATAEEHALRDEALSLLREYASRRGDPMILPSDSLPTLHARLLTLASDRLEHEDLSEQAWTLLDRMEGSLASDSRLVAMDRILEQETAAGARCIVIASTRIDANYIAEHIASTGRSPRVLSGATRSADRRSALSALGPGDCLVATRAMSESADGWPADSAVILWPTNGSVFEAPYLTVAGAPGVTVYELSESSQAAPVL